MDSIFEVVNAGGDNDDPLGLWSNAPQRPAAVSFDVGSTAPETAPVDVPVFRVNLSADLEDARAALARGSDQISLSQRALEGVPDRLEAFVARSQIPQSVGADGAVHFSVPTEPEFADGTPEADLFAMMGEAEREEQMKAEGVVQFAVGEISPWEQAREQFDNFVKQIDREVLHFAWVETNLEGTLLARTTVDWSGDAQTVWDAEASPEEMSLHQRTLKLAMDTRNMRLRLFTTVSTGAAKIALLIATPGGAVMALPLAWKYVSSVLKQTRELQALTQSS
jgi:hypothetical protein